MAEHVAGTVHVDEMLEGMTPEEFAGWMIKDQVEPIGYGQQMLGMIAWCVYSYMAKDSELAAKDFMPWLKHQPAQAGNTKQAWTLWKSVTGG